MGMGGLGRGDDLAFARGGTAERDVVADSAGEQEDVLAHIGDRLAQRAAGDFRDILSVDQDRARLRLVEALDQAHDRGFAGARGADEGGGLGGLRHEREAAQHRLAGAIGELDVAEFDLAAFHREVRQAFGLALRRRAVDDIEQLADIDEVRREIDIDARKPLRRLVGEQERGNDRKEFAGQAAALEHAEARIHHRRRHREAAEHLHQRARARAHARHFVHRLLDLADMRVHACAQHVLHVEGLDHADSLNGLLHGLDDFSGADELTLHDLARAPDERAHADHRDRQGDETNKGEEGVLNDHHRDEANERQKIAADRRDEDFENAARAGRAGIQPVEEFRRMAIGEEGNSLREQIVVEALLITRDDAVADASERDGLAISRKALDGGECDQRAAEHPDRPFSAFDENFIDDVLHQIGGKRRRGGDQKHEHEGERIAPRVAAAVGAQ